MSQWHRLGIPTTIPDGMDDIPELHTIKVRNRRIQVDSPTLVQNNVKTDTVTLDLDGEWDGMSVVLLLGECGGATELAWHGEPITLPSALAERTGGIDVSVVGYSADGETRLVTADAQSVLNVIKSGCTVGEAPGDETPDLIGQLVAAGDAADKAAQSANAAATAANGAAGTANAAAGAANTAAGKANTAATEATDAAGEATDAAGDATRAAQAADAAAEAAGAAAEAARGNVLKGTLGPSPLLSADDAYATKPRKLTVFGETRQNLWVNPSGTSNGVTVTANEDGSITLSGTSAGYTAVGVVSYVLRPGSTYTARIDASPGGKSCASVHEYNASGGIIRYHDFGLSSTSLSTTFTVDGSCVLVQYIVYVPSGITVSGTYRVMLNEGSEAQPWCPPGLNGVDELSIVVSTTDSAEDGTTTPIDLDGHALHSLPDGTRDELRIDGTGAVTLVQRVGVATAPTEASGWTWESLYARASFPVSPKSTDTYVPGTVRCDKLPPGPDGQDSGQGTYAIAAAASAYARVATADTLAELVPIAGGATYLYPLAAPQEVELPGVTLPTLPAPTVNVWADAEASGTGYAMVPDAEMEYERDVTKAIGGLEARVAALEEAQ